MTIQEKFAEICSYQGVSFKENFGSLPFVPKETKLIWKELRREMLGKEIISEYKPDELELGEVFHFLKSIASDSNWYLFYCRTEWFVYADWDGDGWSLGADHVSGSYGWVDGSRLVFRGFLDYSST